MSRNNGVDQLDIQPTNSPIQEALPELLRPNFFAGQLLTSDDLTALGTWMRNRLSLMRRSEGWGVVCGLEVNGDGDSPLGIVLNPGHAVDPAGRDIVVRQQQSISLGRFCRPAGCANGEFDCNDVEPTHVEPFQIGGFSVSGDQVVAVDIWLHYEEIDNDSRPVLPRTNNGRTPYCDAARKHETWRINPQCTPFRALRSMQTQSDAATRDKRLSILDDFARDFPNLWRWEPAQGGFSYAGDNRSGHERFKKKLLDWFHRRLITPSAFLFLPLLFRDNNPLVLPWRVAEALFWLMQSRAATATPCRPCPDLAAGVPLARVWLHTGGADACRVLFIDGGMENRRDFTPPFLHRDGAVNLQSFFGKPWNAVRTTLNWYGGAVTKETVRLPASPLGLSAVFRASDSLTSIHSNEQAVALVSQLPNWENRVLGFQERDANLDRHFVLNNVTLIKWQAGEPDDAPTTDDVMDVLRDRDIPIEGMVKFALEVDLPADGPSLAGEGWRFYVYDSLRDSVQHIDFDAANHAATIVTFVTNSFRVASGPQSQVEFVLIAHQASEPKRNMAVGKVKNWRVALPQHDLTREFKLAYPNAFPTELHYSVLAGDIVSGNLIINSPSNYEITGKYQIAGEVDAPEFTIPQDREHYMDSLQWPLPADHAAATWEKRIDFQEVKSDFDFSISLEPLTVQVDVLRIDLQVKRLNVAGKFSVTLTPRQAGLTLTKFEIRPVDKDVQMTDLSLPGTPLQLNQVFGQEIVDQPNATTEWLVAMTVVRGGKRLGVRTKVRTS